MHMYYISTYYINIVLFAPPFFPIMVSSLIDASLCGKFLAMKYVGFIFQLISSLNKKKSILTQT